jgi:hypothetical protein
VTTPLKPPPIIDDDDLRSAVSALANAAHSYRSVLFKVAAGNHDLIEQIVEHEDLLNLSDFVINAWREHLGLDAENDNTEMPER